MARKRNREGRLTARGRAVTLVLGAKRRALKRGMEFSLELAPIVCAIESGVCAVTGVLFELRPHCTATMHPFSPSLDRIDPQRGYTPDNVRVVITAYNAARGQWGEQVFELMARSFIERNCA